MAGWVYIISNKAMPNILKIGYTERTPYIRAYELYNTGCPYPYKVDYAIYVDRPYEVEQKAHELQRANNVGKEWFSCSFEEAVSTINRAINLLGAKIEPDKKPEAPTPDDIRGIIENNPSVLAIIQKPKLSYDEHLSIKLDNQILEFKSTYYKYSFEKEKINIYEEFNKDIEYYQYCYQTTKNNENKKNTIELIIASMCIPLVPYIIILIVLRGVLDIKQKVFESYFTEYILIYIFIVCITLIYFKIKEYRRYLFHIKNSFEECYKEEIQPYEKKKQNSILRLKQRYSNHFRVINSD